MQLKNISLASGAYHPQVSGTAIVDHLDDLSLYKTKFDNFHFCFQIILVAPWEVFLRVCIISGAWASMVCREIFNTYLMILVSSFSRLFRRPAPLCTRVPYYSFAVFLLINYAMWATIKEILGHPAIRASLPQTSNTDLNIMATILIHTTSLWCLSFFMRKIEQDSVEIVSL